MPDADLRWFHDIIFHAWFFPLLTILVCVLLGAVYLLRRRGLGFRELFLVILLAASGELFLLYFIHYVLMTRCLKFTYGEDVGVGGHLICAPAREFYFAPMWGIFLSLVIPCLLLFAKSSKDENE